MGYFEHFSSSVTFSTLQAHRIRFLPSVLTYPVVSLLKRLSAMIVESLRSRFEFDRCGACFRGQAQESGGPSADGA